MPIIVVSTWTIFKLSLSILLLTCKDSILYLISYMTLRRYYRLILSMFPVSTFVNCIIFEHKLNIWQNTFRKQFHVMWDETWLMSRRAIVIDAKLFLLENLKLFSWLIRNTNLLILERLIDYLIVIQCSEFN